MRRVAATLGLPTLGAVEIEAQEADRANRANGQLFCPNVPEDFVERMGIDELL